MKQVARACIAIKKEERETDFLYCDDEQE